ncbi:hypothetical protein F4781DRAFT_437357 [Annulohypoxylon bovei var. microspora]|nr:hypothetical protein F4781DRAFT_437357 [Annulohypoxylon bovei var. microspora]
MQFSTITTLFTLAAVAIAAPTEVEARNGSPGSCSVSQPNQACCTGSLLDCLVQVSGSACGGQTYCCSTSGDGSFVNVNLLNCVLLL